ncbi:MarR family winged helix-turn-helix transcriptional regulator [Bowmanella denitrificans]|uniref:MarR family winged helix-turn-helix transcriptional regulator n=1 Tax=Bowmanella denitrificans TaxID=366582 RepID=UPI000C9B338C|nr:MarR family transcriptional regulator [Bowmanella denitrificans]
MNSTPCEALRLDNQLCFALYSTSLAMGKLYKPLLNRLGLTYPQYLMMLVLWEEDGLTSTDMGKRLQQDLGALSPVIKRLENQGLLERRRSAEDERRVQLYLTDQGKAMRDQAQQLPGEVLCASGLQLEQLASLKQQLDSLRANLSQASSG